MEFKSYRVELHTCECLNYRSLLNEYKLPKIPKMPLCPNPDYRWDDRWNLPDIPFEDLPTTFVSEEGGHHHIDKKGRSYERLSSWAYAVEEHLKYLSDEWPYKCSKCGKKWRGYESCGDEIIIDGASYCKQCSGIYSSGNKIRSNLDYIADGINLSSLYIQDSPPKFYTSLDAFLKERGLTLDDVKLIHHASPRTGFGWDALSGSISGDHWEIIPKKPKYCVGTEKGFIFNLPMADYATYIKHEWREIS